MPIPVDDHGLEVIRKAAEPLDPLYPKKEYVIRTRIDTSTPVPVSGTVDLGATSLAALENITVTVSNEVEIKNDANNPVPVSGTVGTKTALTPSAPASVSVGVASALAVAANANRKGLILVNVSNKNISLGIGAPAVLNSGITLAPNGSFNMGEYSFTTEAINAIAGGAASALAIQEFTT